MTALDPQSWLHPLDQIDVIDLARLNEHAALQTRVDRKYITDRATLQRLLTEVAGNTRLLEIDGRRQFGYESTYFDTPNLASYFDANRQRPSRYKVRTRTYLDSGDHFVEVKTKSRGAETVKSRRRSDSNAHRFLDETNRTFVSATLDGALPPRASSLALNDVDNLVPTVRTHYQRSTLLVEPTPGGNSEFSRATIDTGLAFHSPGSAGHFHPDVVIVETKGSPLASHVDQALWALGCRALKISKYGVGVALTHPEVNASKWNRVLRRHFDWTPSARA